MTTQTPEDENKAL